MTAWQADADVGATQKAEPNADLDEIQALVDAYVVAADSGEPGSGAEASGRPSLDRDAGGTPDAQ